MKKLINLVLGLTLTSLSLFSQEFLPEKFRNYQARGELSNHYFKVNDTLAILARSYDINRNLWADIWEVYSITDPFKDSIVSKYPEAYLFDLNRDGDFSEEETFFDLNRDGSLTHDEFYRKPKEIQVTSRKEIKL